MTQVFNISHKFVSREINHSSMDELNRAFTDYGQEYALELLKVIIEEEYFSVTGDLCPPDDFWVIYDSCKIHRRCK